MSNTKELIKEIIKTPIELKNAKSKLDTDKEAIITHYLHNNENGAGKAYKKEAIQYTKEILSKNYPDVTFTSIVAEEALQYKLFKMDDIPFPAPEKHQFTFIDLFAGIGGFRMGLQNLGGKCVFSSEWNTYSKKTYDANYGEVPFGDITKVNEHKVPDHDILVGGFPCQPFSIAGVSKKNALGRAHGFKDETQGTLFFDIVRILEAKRPKTFLLENVKNLVSHDKGNTFLVIQGALREIGYSIHFKVLDGKHFVPQHRERIIIVGFDKKVFKGKEEFTFPEMPPADKAIKDILEKNVDPKYTLSDKLWNYLQGYAAKHKAKGNGFGFGLTDLNGISRTISARYYKDGAEILIPQKGKNPRRLTPRECARLQGYPDSFIIPVSDNQAYRQFGNSIVVPLMEAVSTSIVKVLKEK
ncbi:MAG: DNA (cytosine-5-)-methyltransferase [Taibaiella sp.]|jgi:DNA (cytosine-5)-methyltransferase 1